MSIRLKLFHKLDINVNFFHQKRTDILQQRADITSAMGLINNPKANYGAVTNKGLDARIKFQNSFNKDLSLFIRGNFTFARSKIIKYAEPPFPNKPWKTRVGLPVGQLFGLYADRLFVDAAEVRNSPRQTFGKAQAGDIKYRDINGDDKITDIDQIPMGFPHYPEINYGFGFSLFYKNFDFSAFFEGLARESFFIKMRPTSPFYQDHQLLLAYEKNHWSVDNQDITAMFPRFSVNGVGTNNNSKHSTWSLRNGTFMRVKAVQLGYSLPQTLLNKMSIQKLRIYVNARNLFHFSKFKLWDPEMAGNGFGYPLQTSFNIGVHIRF